MQCAADFGSMRVAVVNAASDTEKKVLTGLRWFGILGEFA